MSRRVGQVFFALNVSIALLYVVGWLLAARAGHTWRADFTAIYTGARLVAEKKSDRLYDFEAQRALQKSFLDGGRFADDLLPFYYPPHTATVMAPFGFLERGAAYYAWSAVQLALLVVLGVSLWRFDPTWSRGERVLALGAAAALPSVFNGFLLGTLSLLLLLCVLEYRRALKGERDHRAAAWLALATIKPQLALPGVVLLAGRRWRAFRTFGELGAVALVASSLVVGWRRWPEWFAAARASATFFDRYGVAPGAMYNLKGALALLLGPGRAELINALVAAGLGASVAATVWLWRGPWRPSAPEFDLRMGITILVGMLLGPHLNPADGVGAIAPAFFLYGYLRATGRDTRAFAAFALSCPLVFLAGEYGLGTALRVRVTVVGFVILLAWMVRELRRVGDRPVRIAGAR